jgi:hypothetical protein
MKVCPKCGKSYSDTSLNYCLDDGSVLAGVPPNNVSTETAVMGSSVFSAGPTVPMDVNPTLWTGSGVPPDNSTAPVTNRSRSWIWALLILGAVVLLCGGGIVGLGIYGSKYAAANQGRNDSPTPRPTSTTLIEEESPEPSTTPAGAEYTLTMDQYKQITVGMSRSEVESLLGGKGTQLSSSSGGDTTYTVDEWEGKDYKSIILSFKDDKVITKAQAGLK